MKTLRCWGMNGLTKAVSFVNDKCAGREELRKSQSPEPIQLSTLWFSKSPLENHTSHEDSVDTDFYLFKFSFNFNLIDTVITHTYGVKVWPLKH